MAVTCGGGGAGGWSEEGEDTREKHLELEIEEQRRKPSKRDEWAALHFL